MGNVFRLCEYFGRYFFAWGRRGGGQEPPRRERRAARPRGADQRVLEYHQLPSLDGPHRFFFWGLERKCVRFLFPRLSAADAGHQGPVCDGRGHAGGRYARASGPAGGPRKLPRERRLLRAAGRRYYQEGRADHLFQSGRISDRDRHFKKLGDSIKRIFKDMQKPETEISKLNDILEEALSPKPAITLASRLDGTANDEVSDQFKAEYAAMVERIKGKVATEPIAKPITAADDATGDIDYADLIEEENRKK